MSISPQSVFCLLVDLGSDDQQVPVFSDQLLWNPYWSPPGLNPARPSPAVHVFTPWSSSWRLDVWTCRSWMCRLCVCVCVISSAFVFLRSLKIYCNDSGDVTGPRSELHPSPPWSLVGRGGGGGVTTWRELRGTTLLASSPWKCWDFPAALEHLIGWTLLPEHGTFALSRFMLNCVRWSTCHLHHVLVLPAPMETLLIIFYLKSLILCMNPVQCHVVVFGPPSPSCSAVRLLLLSVPPCFF